MWLLVIVLVAVGFHLLREYWARRALGGEPVRRFEGTLYRVGETGIAVRRPAGKAARTLICIPGFLEDSTYFLDVHAELCDDDELILVNNALYHSPFDETEAQSLDWEPNPYPPGTIAHDGVVLARVIEHLAGGDEIVIHGHSRGGAATLDAGRQFPQLVKHGNRPIRALLEAPVLPQGTQAGRPTGPVAAAITYYFLPTVFAMLRNASERRLAKMPMMRPTSEVKRSVLKTLFRTPKNYATCVVNARDIAQWQKTQRHDLYENFHHITILVGERDDVLSTRTMLASAEEGARRNSGVRIVQTTNTNHFISLERPELLRAALASHPEQTGSRSPG